MEGKKSDRQPKLDGVAAPVVDGVESYPRIPHMHIALPHSTRSEASISANSPARWPQRRRMCFPKAAPIPCRAEPSRA